MSCKTRAVPAQLVVPKDLRQLSEAATPGPWSQWGTNTCRVAGPNGRPIGNFGGWDFPFGGWEFPHQRDEGTANRNLTVGAVNFIRDLIACTHAPAGESPNEGDRVLVLQEPTKATAKTAEAVGPATILHNSTTASGMGEQTDSLAARDVLTERRRQVEVEGWTAEHDDGHTDGSLALAGAAYAIQAVDPQARIDVKVGRRMEFAKGGWMELARFVWPKSWDREQWKPQNPRRDLVRAAALILAEIERLDRTASSDLARGDALPVSASDKRSK